MALSGDFRIGSGASWLWLYVKWTATQSTSGNYSDVKADVYIQRSGGATAYNASSNNLNININGGNGNYSKSFDLRNQTSQWLGSQTTRVNHNSDGTKSFSISVSYATGISGIGTPSGSASFTLDDIPRAYGFNYSSDTVQYDSPVTLLVFGNGSGNKANVYFNIGGKEVLAYSNAPFDTNFAVTPKLSDFANITPDMAAAIGYVIVKTFTPDGTLIGGNQKLFTFTMSSSVIPSISNVAQTELVTKIKAVTGSSTLYIANMSQIQLTTTANGIYGSTIKEYNVRIGNLSFTSTSNVQTIDLSQYNIGTGSIVATITVTDSRGRKASIDVTLNVQAYSPPMLKNFKVTRNMDLNTTINIVKSVAVSSIKNGTTEKNSYTVVTKYKKTVDTAWITAKTETNTSANFALTGMAIESSYDIQVTITDKLSESVTVQSNVPSIFMIMSWSATTVGIGKAAEQGVLDIAGKLSDIYVGGISLLDLQHPINSVYQSFDPTDPSILFGGTWTRIAKGQVLVGVDESDPDFSTSGKTGGEKTHTLKEPELPKLSGSQSFHGAGGIGTNLGGATGIITDWGKIDNKFHTNESSTGASSYGTFNINFGGDQAHNNLQPYTTVYTWRRTA